MGPTSIIPCSYLCGVNREGFFHSEDRVREELLSPQTLSGWQATMAEFPENSNSGVRPALIAGLFCGPYGGDGMMQEPLAMTNVRLVR